MLRGVSCFSTYHYCSTFSLSALSFGVLFLYWELGITLPKRGSHATPLSEAIIIVIVFGAYLA